MPRPPAALLALTLSLGVASPLARPRPATAGAGSGSSLAPAGGEHHRARWRAPVDGDVVRAFRFGPDPYARGWHRGVTFAARPGAAVRAACGGRVLFAGRVARAGRAVTVACGPLNATLTRLGALRVRRGDTVAPGRLVAAAGRGGLVQLGARVRAMPHGYLDPLRLIAGAAPPPPGLLPPVRMRPPARPRPVPAGRPRSVPVAAPPPVPVPVATPRPTAGPAGLSSSRPYGGLPLGGWWLPTGTALLLAALGFGAARRGRAVWRRRTVAVATVDRGIRADVARPERLGR